MLIQQQVERVHLRNDSEFSEKRKRMILYGISILKEKKLKKMISIRNECSV